MLGFGRIGQHTFKLLQPYEPGKLLYLNSKPGKRATDLVGAIASAQCPVEPAESIEQLARESDLLLICVNLTPETHHLVDASFIRSMKKTATIVNVRRYRVDALTEQVGRGAVADSEALADALEQDRLFAVGLDVIESACSSTYAA